MARDLAMDARREGLIFSARRFLRAAFLALVGRYRSLNPAD
jgi:hypothetical protein